MTWAATLLTLRKCWAWTKKNWQLFVGMAVPVVLFLITRRPPNLSKVLERTREDYEKELEALERAHQKEIELRDQAQKRAIEVMLKVEESYRAEQKDLNDQKRKEIENLLKSDQSADEITKRLSEITGFKIHVE